MTQTQKAGSGSSQYQVNGDIVHQTFQMGPSRQEMEVALREEGDRILETIRKEVAATYVAEGVSLAAERIGSFDDKLLDVLAEEGTLQALKDPAFQFVLKKAQMGAATTEREGDHELLASLLGERSRDDDRRARASIARAVDVVDSLDDSALQGLTILFYLWDFRPGASGMDAGLDNFSRSLGEIGCDVLPQGDGWLDHIDILGLARVDRSGAQTLKPFEEKLAITNSGYTCSGVSEDQKQSVEYKFMSEAAVEIRLVPHELKAGYYRLPFSDEQSLDGALKGTPLDATQRQRALDIANLECGIDKHDPLLVESFRQAMDKRPDLAVCRAWWNQIPHPPMRTSIGTAIAYSNASRLTDLTSAPPLHAYLTR